MFDVLKSATALALIAAAAPAFADRFEAEADLTAVTLYPQGAGVSRVVTLTLPVGTHEVIVPGLPRGTDARSLRVVPTGAASVGAVSLAQGRQPVTEEATGPEAEALEAEIERLEEDLRGYDRRVAGIRLRVDAAEEQVAFLRSLAGQSAVEALDETGLDEIRALTALVGEEVLAARQAALAAEEEARAVQRERADVAEELERAKRELAALSKPAEEGDVLTLAVEAEEAGEVTLTISTQVQDASWSPVYDLSLDTDAQTVAVDRGVVVSQSSGEDWGGVDLTLSTARPGGQVGPGQVWPTPLRIIDEDDLEQDGFGAPMADIAVMEVAPAPVAAARADAGMSVEMLGATVTYVYDRPVDIRDGVDALRLTLGTVEVPAEVHAEAVPARDATAYLVAAMTNDAGEILLPGQARLIADGALVGEVGLPLVAAGAEVDLGFGPIDGLQLTRAVPSRTEGERGVIGRANVREETAIITVENLTARTWDVLVRDAVPYSEQDDLEIEVTATPAITTRDPEGMRGIVEWRLDVAAGEEAEIAVETVVTWPEGYVLR